MRIQVSLTERELQALDAQVEAERSAGNDRANRSNTIGALIQAALGGGPIASRSVAKRLAVQRWPEGTPEREVDYEPEEP